MPADTGFASFRWYSPGTTSRLVIAFVSAAWAFMAIAVLRGDETWMHHDSPSTGALTGLTFIGSWTLMVAALMLPTTLWFVSVFDRIVAERADRLRLGALVVAGYLTVWLVAGSVAFALDEALHGIDDATGALSRHDWLVPAGALALAGAFQLTPLKARCLARCRTPYSFVATRWHDVRPRHEAWRLGMEHGRFCLGCCWALMLVMTALSAIGLVWMLLIASVMAAEKLTPAGARLARPVGVTCLALAIAVPVVG